MVCKACGGVVAPKGPGPGRQSLYCSEDCRKAFWHPAKRHGPRVCGLESCGASFVPRQANQRFCSRPCARRWDTQARKGAWGPYAFRVLFVLERGGRCEGCGVEGGRELEVHHVVPFADGGENVPANVRVLCRACHKATPDYGRSHAVRRRSPVPPVDISGPSRAVASSAAAKRNVRPIPKA